MVRANGANTNAEIHASLSCPPQAEDRDSMHPPQPREAERVARWLLGRRKARGRAWSALRARLLRASPDGAATLSSRTARARKVRMQIPANPNGTRASQTARQ